MNILCELRRRFRAALADLSDEADELVDLVRRSQDPKFGDYQANLAMPLAKQLGRPPRQVAEEIVERLDVSGVCAPPEIAGPGFINLRIDDAWLAGQLAAAVADPRLGIARVEKPRTFVIDYSAPNVAKPMHVGHIRSTVIGDSLYRLLGFLGHRAIGDNHIGDWGTQFGMIIYGYRHFRDDEAFRANPVAELARLYRLVNQLVGYYESRDELVELDRQIASQEEAIARHDAAADTSDKQAAKQRGRMAADLGTLRGQREEVLAKIDAVEKNPELARLAREHAHIASAVLNETAKLHAGDEENRRLWHQFVPACLVEIDRLYRRLGVKFDHTLGESFYHDRLAKVVAELKQKQIARPSEGALCIFFDDIKTPMIVQKKDGAFLYATTDLATIQYRMENWHPDAMLYVVGQPQSLHFEQLFAAARLWGYRDVELVHVAFGSVLGEDGRPFRTRAGDTVALEGLLDEAVRRARHIVAENDDAKPEGPELSDVERDRIAEVVGIGALKYADLAQNRTSDYVFSYEKMLAMQGNTATYMQYAYARVRSIFAKGNVDIDHLRGANYPIRLVTPAERALGLELLRLSEALEHVVADYRPNHLTAYLFDLAGAYSTFYQQCPVLAAESETARTSRLLLCDLTARTLKQGLALLGIEVVERM